MQTHTSHEFEAELRQLKDRLLAMGGRCERMIEMAIRAFEEQDPDLSSEVVQTDHEMNRDELDADDLAVRILALRQPVGRDLRFVVTAVKVDTDLERIGDLAVNIAERAAEMVGHGAPPEPFTSLPPMARLAIEMLHDALDAFVEEDPDKARTVLTRDDRVDDIHHDCLRKCVEYMQQNPQRADGGLRIVSSAKYIERIADHATNIAEMVVYLVQAVDLRHKGKLGK
jgi:phosphate transport system protein